jgi:coenzyme F420-dependent glucose-6-phosphate dehydrogenase
VARIGYHAPREQHRPSTLLTYVQQAEAAGFESAMCSDHFHPWNEDQGQSGFAWSWLGSALQTTSLSMGTVCAPGQRYHPAVIAQAAATLAEMHPDRFWVALGSGQALNELGFDEVLLHSVHRDQETFIRDFASRVLPELDR